MALDKSAIGLRIRKIREEVYHENRSDFSYRCSITESHLGQIERGEIMISLNALDKIVVSTGTDTDYLLYGKNEIDENRMKKMINNFLDRADKSVSTTTYQNLLSENG